MLIRLLVAVLTLVGPMPFRVCTCAAGSPSQPVSGAATAPAKVKKCRCADCGPVVGNTSGEAGPVHCEAPPPSPQHDNDCPAVKPSLAVREAATPSTSDAPPDDGSLHAATPAEPLALAGAPAALKSERPHSRRTPLYITFLSLRN